LKVSGRSESLSPDGRNQTLEERRSFSPELAKLFPEGESLQPSTKIRELMNSDNAEDKPQSFQRGTSPKTRPRLMLEEESLRRSVSSPLAAAVGLSGNDLDSVPLSPSQRRFSQIQRKAMRSIEETEELAKLWQLKKKEPSWRESPISESANEDSAISPIPSEREAAQNGPAGPTGFPIQLWEPLKHFNSPDLRPDITNGQKDAKDHSQQESSLHSWTHSTKSSVTPVGNQQASNGAKTGASDLQVRWDITPPRAEGSPPIGYADSLFSPFVAPRTPKHISAADIVTISPPATDVMFRRWKSQRHSPGKATQGNR